MSMEYYNQDNIPGETVTYVLIEVKASENKVWVQWGGFGGRNITVITRKGR